jgi:hypothetical protein
MSRVISIALATILIAGCASRPKCLAGSDVYALSSVTIAELIRTFMTEDPKLVISADKTVLRTRVSGAYIAMHPEDGVRAIQELYGLNMYMGWDTRGHVLVYLASHDR